MEKTSMNYLDAIRSLAGNYSLRTLALSAAAGYVLLVRALRWRKYHAIHRKYQAKYKSKTMSPEEAQEVIIVSAGYDMPMLLNYSLAFALFKTYAIPTISKLLTQTKQLSSEENVSRRYSDTEILISTFVACPISGIKVGSPGRGDSKAELDPRANIALARMNWLHSKFEISNDDFLYTLCLFVLEPSTWAEKFGWRPLSPLEQYATYVFWAEIGRRMNIKDIPGSFEELRAWSIAYEEKCMVPAQTNKEVAGHTTSEIIAAVPENFGLKRFAERLTVCAMEERVRVAMMQPVQPWYMHAILRSTMASFSFVERWLLLPRRTTKFTIDASLPELVGSSCPRMHPTKFAAKPWYKPKARGLAYYFDLLAVKIGFYNEMPSANLKCDGYRLEEIGPTYLEQTGHEEVMRIASELQGFPVPTSWSSK